MNFARLLAQIIRFKPQFPDYAIKTVRLDNAGEFKSHAFNDYFSTEITNEHLVLHMFILKIVSQSH